MPCCLILQPFWLIFNNGSIIHLWGTQAEIVVHFFLTFWQTDNGSLTMFICLCLQHRLVKHLSQYWHCWHCVQNLMKLVYKEQFYVHSIWFVQRVSAFINDLSGCKLDCLILLTFSSDHKSSKQDQFQWKHMIWIGWLFI